MNRLLIQFVFFFSLLCLPLTVAAEETYLVFPEQHPKLPDLNRRTTSSGIPGAVETIDRLSHRPASYNQKVPGSPGEALEMLDQLATRIDHLSNAVTQFRVSRDTLLTSINNLGKQTRKNHHFLVSWAPVLLGNLRLIRQRPTVKNEDLWLLVAIVVLEKQVSSLGQRIRQANTSDLILSRLDAREDRIELQRDQLYSTLGDIKKQLYRIRREANTRG